ncbi:hypothetical protein AB0D86_09485 [Streptomyces sp. NPDC048324]|uniref:hypothetical protein n=1 Tax=Streptomyces sp. NPDC048324 TaxID=3157205 RepID=UPI003440D7CA
MCGPPLRASRAGRLTLGWNVIGIVVLAVAAVSARSVALAGFGLDSLIEIGASAVVIRELSGTGEERRRRALRLTGVVSHCWPSTCWRSPPLDGGDTGEHGI